MSSKSARLFSKACEYGIRAVILISKRSLDHERVSLKEIADDIQSPEAFTAKILQTLVRHDIVRSVKGPGGGFEIPVPRIDRIMLSAVVTAIDGDDIYLGCGLGLSECSEEMPCPLHDKFAKVRDDLRKMLDSTSLYEMTIGLETGMTYLKRV